jgi:filamentous hemagglutinin family protein
LLPASAIAQEAPITADGTTATSITTTDGSNFDIDGGDKAGGNLFHSFGNFSVPNAGSANFLNSPDIVNIINRVTGGKLSEINGLLKANGSANLFLINPAGIIFGDNARLDIGGSFLGSTADRLLFNDGTEFSASNLSKPILTINAPIGLGFRDNPENITNQSTVNGLGLQVDTGKNITLIGGNLNFERGIITAPGGRVELGGLSAKGTININENGSLTFPVGITRSDVFLSNGASVDVRAGEGGFITVNARNLELLDSKISALASENANGGNINIDAKFIVAFPNQNNDIIATAQLGKGGRITINAKRIYGFDRERIQSIDVDPQTLTTNNKNDINSTSADPTLSGTVNLNTEQLDPAKERTQSLQGAIEPDETIASACGTDGSGALTNTFTITGRGGMPTDPTKPLNSSYLSGDFGSKEAEEQRGGGDEEKRRRGDALSLDENKKTFSSDDVIPARGMIVNEKGQIVLTAYPTPNVSDRTTPQSNYCAISSK